MQALLECARYLQQQFCAAPINLSDSKWLHQPGLNLMLPSNVCMTMRSTFQNASKFGYFANTLKKISMLAYWLPGATELLVSHYSLHVTIMWCRVTKIFCYTSYTVTSVTVAPARVFNHKNEHLDTLWK